MRIFHYALFICLLIIVGCQSESKKKESRNTEVRVIKTKKSSDTIYNTPSAIDSSQIKIESPEKFSTKYIVVEYKQNKKDTVFSELKIAENIITFFVPNRQHEELKKFRKNGFPMEFWGTEMCPFFGILYSELDSKIQIAKNLGYSDYGFDCEITKNKTSESKVLINQILIEFKPNISYEEKLKILTTNIYSDFYKIDYLPNTYYAKLVNRSAKNIIKQYQKLINNEKIEFVQFCFGGCSGDEILNHI